MRSGETVRLYSPSAEPSESELVYQSEHPIEPYPCAIRMAVTLSDDTLRRNLSNDDTGRRDSLVCGRLPLPREADVTKLAVPTESRLQWLHGNKSLAAASDTQLVLGRSSNLRPIAPLCSAQAVERDSTEQKLGWSAGDLALDAYKMTIAVISAHVRYLRFPTISFSSLTRGNPLRSRSVQPGSPRTIRIHCFLQHRCCLIPPPCPP